MKCDWYRVQMYTRHLLSFPISPIKTAVQVADITAFVKLLPTWRCSETLPGLKGKHGVCVELVADICSSIVWHLHVVFDRRRAKTRLRLQSAHRLRLIVAECHCYIQHTHCRALSPTWLPQTSSGWLDKEASLAEEWRKNLCQSGRWSHGGPSLSCLFRQT